MRAGVSYQEQADGAKNSECVNLVSRHNGKISIHLKKRIQATREGFRVVVK